MATLQLDPQPRPVAAAATATTRILHIVNGEHYAGAERVQDHLAERLPEFGFQVGFACVKPDQFPARRRCQAAPLIGALMRSRTDLRPARLLARVIRDDGYAAVHTHTPRAALVGRVASWLAGVPMIHHVHSPTSRDSTRRVINWASTATERLSLLGVAAAIGVSQAMGRFARALGVSPERTWVVPNGVPCRQGLPERAAPRGVWTLGAVALFRPRKGLEILLDALAELRERHVPVRLRAVGTFETPEYEQEIRARVKKLEIDDCVTWTGFCSNVAAELDQMDLFILPSLFGEGLPMVILEAMASGVPIVATHVEGVPEAIRHGQDGLLVPPHNASQLAEAIERYVARDVDWQAVRQSALQRQRELFSDDSMANGVAEVYRAVLGE